MRPLGHAVLALGAAFLTGASEPAAAQTNATLNSAKPTVRLGATGTVPTYNVSSMRLDIGDYSLKPVYQVQGDQVRVVGFFATPLPGTAVGSNLQAVWYGRPDVECDEWVVVTWSQAPVADAIKSLKQTYAIPDEQDIYWELPVGGAATNSVLYNEGFVDGDPMKAAADAMTPEQREAFMALLKNAGYSIATMEFEKEGPAAATAWLVAQARFFDAMIGRNLTGQAFEEAFEQQYIALGPPILFDPTCELIDLVCDLWFCRRRPAPPPTCTPKTIYGEWQPAGELCNCTTEGPWSAICGEFTANAEGKIVINIPFPPPRGTRIELSVGVGVTINLCVCMWQRTCTGQAQRTVTTINADCSRSTTTEYKDGHVFTATAWQTAYPAEQCQQAARPGSMPPADQPCGLTTN